MKFIATALACASVAAAQVISGTTLLLTADANLAGRGLTFQYTAGQCINVPLDFNDVVSSVAPQGSGHSCTLFRDFNCAGPTFDVTAYVPFLTDFNDQVSSFRCSS